MNSYNTRFTTKTVANYLILTTAAVVFSSFWSFSQAQTMYRIVGADGKVTFSDKPPAPAEKSKVTTSRTGNFSTGSDESLPTELRNALQKFPVTLYTATGCSGCDSARSALKARGIPMRELLVQNEQDTAELKRISGESSLPLITIGAQQIKGFAADEINNYLDLAGYPKPTRMPQGYKDPAPTPVVERPRTAAAPAAPSAATPSSPEGVVTTTRDFSRPLPQARQPAARNENPNGIRF
jgi:glutaredoxin